MFQGLAGRFLGSHDQELDLSEAQRRVGIFRPDREDFFDGLQDGVGNERRTIGALFDAAAKKVVERLGVDALMAEFFVDELGSDHKKHLLKELVH